MNSVLYLIAQLLLILHESPVDFFKRYLQCSVSELRGITPSYSNIARCVLYLLSSWLFVIAILRQYFLLLTICFTAHQHQIALDLQLF